MGTRSWTNYIYNEQMDQSALYVQLFTFHAAGASVHGRDTVHDSSEPHGSCNVQYHLPILDPWLVCCPFWVLPSRTQVLELLWPTPCQRLSGGFVQKAECWVQVPPTSPPCSCSKSRQSWNLCFGYVMVSLRVKECCCCIDIFVFAPAYV